MYLQIAQRSPRMIAAINCVSTVVSTSTFASSNSRAKCLFNVASEIGLPSSPLTRRQTRSCDIPQDKKLDDGSVFIRRYKWWPANLSLRRLFILSLFSISHAFDPSGKCLSDQARRLLAFHIQVVIRVWEHHVDDDKGQRDRAIQDYDQAIRLNPNYAEAYYNRGTILHALGQQVRAAADFAKARQLNPKRPPP